MYIHTYTFRGWQVTVRPGIFSDIWVTDRPGIFSHIFLTLTQTDSQTAQESRHRWPVNNLDPIRSVTAILKFTRKLKNSYQLNLKTVILKINWILPWVGTYKWSILKTNWLVNLENISLCPSNVPNRHLQPPTPIFNFISYGHTKHHDILKFNCTCSSVKLKFNCTGGSVIFKFNCTCNSVKL